MSKYLKDPYVYETVLKIHVVEFCLSMLLLRNNTWVKEIAIEPVVVLHGKDLQCKDYLRRE